MKNTLILLCLLFSFSTAYADTQADLSILAGPIVQNRNDIDSAKNQVIGFIESSISDAIRSISMNAPDPINSAVALNKLITASRQTLLNDVDTGFSQGPITPQVTTALGLKINADLKKIQSVLAPQATSVSINLTEHSSDITAVLSDLDTQMSAASSTLSSLNANLLFVDSDKDGLSDYDELYIYHTNPNKAVTTPMTGTTTQLTDGQKVLAGIDPLTNLPFASQEDAKTSTVPVNPAFSISKVSLQKNQNGNVIQMSGRALPNAIVTIYLYSTPIIVSVKADSSGVWTYTFDKELDNGQHVAYATEVNNSGKIVARSSALDFTKSAEAATIDSVSNQPAPAQSTRPSLLSGKAIYIFAGVFILVSLLVLALMGRG